MRRKNKTKRNAKKASESKSNHFATWTPIIISIVSVVFGAYQYFDKRHLETANAELMNQAKSIEIEQKKLETRKEELQNQASIEIQYVESDLQPFLFKLGDVYDEPLPIPITNENDFNKNYLKWLSILEQKLPYKIRLIPLLTLNFEEIKRQTVGKDILDSQLSLFLIRNAGTSKVSTISTQFTQVPAGKLYPIKVDRLEPGTGVIFIIGLSNRKTREFYGSRLIPGTQIKYYDEFNKKQEGLIVREPFEVPQIIDYSKYFHSTS